MANVFSRRDIFKGAAAAGLAAAVWKPSLASARVETGPVKSGGLPDKLMAHPRIPGHPNQEKFWAHVRTIFPLPPRGHYYHYNTGTTGSQPFYSINNLAVYNLYKSQDPVNWEKNLAWDDGGDLFAIPGGASSAINDKRAEIAQIFNANQDEIILSYNTSDAYNQVFTGIKWNSGDRIVTTNMEHPCGDGATSWARDVHGVTVSVVDIPFDGTASQPGFNMSVNDFVELFRPALSAARPAGAKQFLSFSQISYKNGFVMPAKELTALAHSFPDTWVIIDSAHGWGQLVMNCHDIGADFIAGAGHKWLCGGPGTGVFFARASSGSYPLAPWNPETEGWGTLFSTPARFVPDTSRNLIRPVTDFNSGVQSRGEYNRCAVYAMVDSARFWEYLGLDTVYARGTALAAYLQQKIVKKWGPSALFIQQGVDQRFKGFVTACNPFKGNRDPANFAAQTAAIGKIVSNLDGFSTPYVSTAGTPDIYLASRSWPNRFADGKSTRAVLRISTHAMYCSNEETDYVFDQIAKQVDASGLAQLP
jgi:selenocysteine lyase/cysteine desulfurase